MTPQEELAIETLSWLKAIKWIAWIYIVLMLIVYLLSLFFD